MRQAEVTAAKTMIDRTARAASTCGPSGWPPTPAMARPRCWPGWSHERGIEPHIPVFDKSEREDGTFSRDDFAYDHERDVYVCPGGKALTAQRRAYRSAAARRRPGRHHALPRQQARLRRLRLKPRCCPNTPARKVTRSIHEGARDKARDIAKTDAYVTSRRERKKVEMLFAHLKRILKLDRLRLRGPCGARDEFLLAATAQNLRKLAKLIPVPVPLPAA